MIDPYLYLQQIERDKAEIRSIDAEIKTYEALATNTAAPSGNTSGRASGTSDKVGKNAGKIGDLITKKEAAKDKLINDIEERAEFIKQIDDVLQYEILHMIYVDGMSIKEIARKKHFSEVWISKNHTRAINKLYILLNSID